MQLNSLLLDINLEMCFILKTLVVFNSICTGTSSTFNKIASMIHCHMVISQCLMINITTPTIRDYCCAKILTYRQYADNCLPISIKHFFKKITPVAI